MSHQLPLSIRGVSNRQTVPVQLSKNSFVLSATCVSLPHGHYVTVGFAKVFLRTFTLENIVHIQSLDSRSQTSFQRRRLKNSNSFSVESQGLLPCHRKWT